VVEELAAIQTCYPMSLQMIARNMDRGRLSIKRTLEGSQDREA